MITRRIGRTQKVKLGAGRIALYKYRNRKAGQGAGAVLSAPPVPESLLIWLKGISTDTQKTDSWAKPDAENFDIKQSNCIALNGVDESGDSGLLLNTNHTVITFNGVVPSVTGSNLPLLSNDNNQVQIYFDGGNHRVSFMYTDSVSGSFYINTITVPLLDVGSIFSATVTISPRDNLEELIINGDTVVSQDYQGSGTIADTGKTWLVGARTTLSYLETSLWSITIDGIHFRIAEGNESEFSWSDDGTRYITWTGSLDEMWAQRQDTYHGNCVDGFGKAENLIEYSEDLTQVVAKNFNVTEVSDIELDMIADYAKSYRLFVPVIGETYTFKFKAKLGTATSVSYRIKDETNGVIIIDITEYATLLNTSTYSEVSAEFTVPVGCLSVGVYAIITDIGPRGTVFITEQQVTSGNTTYIKTENYTFTGEEYLPFLNTNPGGTWNDCESAFGPESFPVGTSNGTDDYINTDSLSVDDPLETFLSVMITPTRLNHTTVQSIIRGSNSNCVLEIDSGTDTLKLKIKNSSGAWNVLSTTIAVDEPILITGEYRDGSVFLVIDGVDQDSGTWDGTFYTSGSQTFELGDFSNVYPFQGIIRDVNINGTLIPINEGSGTAIHTPSYGDLDKTNEVEWSEDFSNSYWNTYATCTVSGTNTINLPAINDRLFKSLGAFSAGQKVTLKIIASGVSGETISIVPSGYTADGQLQITLTEEATEYTYTVTLSADVAVYVMPVRKQSTDTATQVTLHSVGVAIDEEDFTYIKTEDYTYKLGYGRSIGNLSTSDADSFWNDSEPMVSQEVMDMEAVQDTQFLTDGLGHPLYLTQDGFGELGEEFFSKSLFNEPWNYIDVGASFTGGQLVIDGTQPSNKFTSEPYEGNITNGEVYRVVVDVAEYTAGGEGFDVRIGYGNVSPTIKTAGIHTFDITIISDASLLLQYILYKVGTTCKINSVSVREVNPTMNNNDQYFRKDCVGSNTEYFFYKQVLTGDDLETVKVACCLL